MNQSLPETFSLETALACNLRCPECAIGGAMVTRKRGFLDFERYRHVADKIRPFVKHFYLHLWGEPMMNKDIIRMVRYAAEFTTTNISTNGLLMTPEGAEELITSGVTDVIVSIDGTTQETYEKYRVGGQLPRALAALAMLRHYNDKHGDPVCIIPQFIVFQHNQHQLDAFTEFCGRMGLSPSFKSPYIRLSDSTFAFPDDPKYQRPHYPDVASLKTAMMECSNPRNVFTMLLDGSVVICCHDYDRVTNFGNIFEQDVMEIWNSPGYRKYREDVLSGRAPDFCVDNCMTYFLEEKSDPKKRLPMAVGI